MDLNSTHHRVRVAAAERAHVQRLIVAMVRRGSQCHLSGAVKTSAPWTCNQQRLRPGGAHHEKQKGGTACQNELGPLVHPASAMANAGKS